MSTITRRIATRPGVLSAIWRSLVCRYLRWSIASDEDYLRLLRREGFKADERAFASRIEVQRVRLAQLEAQR